MRLREIFLVVTIITPLFCFAQRAERFYQPPVQVTRNFEPNVLSIFSENGQMFYVVLNGIKQNNNPQSIIRIEGVPQTENEIKIFFADNVTPAIERRITIANPIDERPVNLALRIAKNHEGYTKLHFYLCEPREHDYKPAQGEYVMQYGRDIQTVVEIDRDRYRDHDRDRDRDREHEVVVVNTPPPPPAPPAGPVPMDRQSFESALQTVKSTSFDETKLSTAKMIANSNYFTTDQVIQMCRLFSFEDNKLDFAKYVFKRTVDNSNYFKVNTVFNFDSNKEALNEFVNQNH